MIFKTEDESMQDTYQCLYCKETIDVVDNNPELSALVHLSEVHGVIAPPIQREMTPEEKEEDERLTQYLLRVRGRKINN